jgi:hypothetical protein
MVSDDVAKYAWPLEGDAPVIGSHSMLTCDARLCVVRSTVRSGGADERSWWKCVEIREPYDARIS